MTNEPNWSALREELLSHERKLNQTITEQHFPQTETQHCDFCYALNPSPSKIYACQSFRIAAAIEDDGSDYNILNSSGSWLACMSCAALINANNILALTERALAGNGAEIITDPGERMLLRRFLKAQFEQFMRLKARTQ